MNKTKLPGLVSILILTLITSTVWISFNVYRALSLKPDPVVPPEISEPLVPTLDTETITSVSDKIFFDDSEVPQINPKSTTVRQPIEIISEESTGSAETQVND